VLPLGLFASPQKPDYIIYKKDTISTYNLILEQYLQRIDTTKTEKLFGLNFRNGSSFNCWRGYQAIYKIENDSLFLTDIINCGELLNKINKFSSIDKMKNIFGDKVNNNKVYIDWFSGYISFPLNNKLLRWDGVFYKIYEKETLINVSNGKVLKIENINNYISRPNSIGRKNKDKVSDILFKKLKKVKWENTKKFDCSEKYLITIDENGKVSKVNMSYQTEEEMEKHYDNDEYIYCIETIRNALKELKFDIILDKGKPISENIYIEIFFDNDNEKLENWTR
jgi:hypothetical protein